MAEIVAALIVACLSGITFLAYRHPPAYQRVLSAVTPVAVGLLIGGILLSIYAIFVGCVPLVVDFRVTSEPTS